MNGPIRDLIWRRGDGPAHRRALTRPAIYTLLGLVILVLGLNWPIMATGLESISPFWMGAFRIVGAFVVVLIIGATTRNLIVPPRHDLPVVFSLAILRLSLVVVLVFIALQLVPAGRSSVVAWTTPLWTVPIAAIWVGERVSGRRWTGLLVGIVGVVVVAQPWSSDWSDPGVALAYVLLIVAAITNATTAVHIRAHEWTITPIQALPWQLGYAAVILVVTALSVEGVPTIDWTPQLAWIVAYQGILATGIAFWAQIVIFRNIPAVSANLSLMGVPVVGVVSSAILLGEQIDTALVAGMAMILAAVVVNVIADSGDEGIRIS